MPSIPQNVSKSTRERNPHLYSVVPAAKTPPRAIQSAGNGIVEPVVDGVEIRTNLICAATTDVCRLNKWEKAFYNYLLSLNYCWVGVQCISLKIGADCRYICDFWAIGFDGELIGFEVKGYFRPQAKIKMAVVARQYPWIRFKLVRKDKSGWKIDDVKP